MTELELSKLVASRPGTFSWFLGAGTSRSCGIPTANDIVWDLKCKLYSEMETRNVQADYSIEEAMKDKLQAYFDSRHFPPREDPWEYSIYFKEAFGSDREAQRKYIESQIDIPNSHLTIGYRALAALLHNGHCNTAFTTNFDNLLDIAFERISGRTLLSFGLNDADGAAEALSRSDFPFVCKMHGDFRYDKLKNLTEDLIDQNEMLAECFCQAVMKAGLVVTGYSGRDDSVMEMFRSAVKRKGAFPFGLFWTGIKGEPSTHRVHSLIKDFQSKGVEAEYIEIGTFDTLMLRTFREVDLKDSDNGQLVWRQGELRKSIPLPEQSSSSNRLIRSNAVPVLQVPSECFVVNLRTPKNRQELTQARGEAGDSLIFGYSGRLRCWGQQDDIERIFGKDVLDIVCEEWNQPGALLATDMGAKELVERAICQALVWGKPFKHRRYKHASYIIVDARSEDQGQLHSIRAAVGEVEGRAPANVIRGNLVPGECPSIFWAEAVRVAVESRNDTIWLLFDPYVWVSPTDYRRNVQDLLRQRRRQVSNRDYVGLLEAWLSCLLSTNDGSNVLSVSAPINGYPAEATVFKIGTKTAFFRSNSK